MSSTPTPASPPAGIAPWFPWPLSAWSAWTEPVRAERLAALRIGFAACLIFDVAYNYAPETFAYFAKGGLADPTMVNWRFLTPRTNWSLLRGVGDEANLYLSLTCWMATTLWILGNSGARLLFVHKNPPAHDRTGIALCLWLFALAWYTAGLWSRMIADGRIDDLAWVVPLLGFALACLFYVLDIATRLRDPDHAIPWFKLLQALGSSAILVVIGFCFWQFVDVKELDATAWWVRLLQSWQDDRSLLATAMALWIGCAALLLLGCATRFAAIATWMLSISFANANQDLDNAGDTIRLIVLFYLMLCPCGAAWSIDAVFRKRPGPVFVHPWPIRVIFFQMIFIYFMNGVYKLCGRDWWDGNSMYYVLGDIALTRFSQMSVPLPDWLYFRATQAMTWSVLAWEVSFPLLVIFKWPRRFALVCGVMFHLGIFATMELGGFVPYALCMYLPLLPWGRSKPGGEIKRVSGE